MEHANRLGKLPRRLVLDKRPCGAPWCAQARHPGRIYKAAAVVSLRYRETTTHVWRNAVMGHPCLPKSRLQKHTCLPQSPHARKDNSCLRGTNASLNLSKAQLAGKCSAPWASCLAHSLEHGRSLPGESFKQSRWPEPKSLRV